MAFFLNQQLYFSQLCIVCNNKSGEFTKTINRRGINYGCAFYHEYVYKSQLGFTPYSYNIELVKVRFNYTTPIIFTVLFAFGTIYFISHYRKEKRIQAENESELNAQT